jgi:hypothetical protein
MDISTVIFEESFATMKPLLQWASSDRLSNKPTLLIGIGFCSTGSITATLFTADIAGQVIPTARCERSIVTFHTQCLIVVCIA